MRKTKIVMLARDCDSTTIVYNYLKQFYEFDTIVLEKTISKSIQFGRRTKLLGFWTATGQVAFMIIIFPLLKLFSQKRKNEIFNQFHLDLSPLPDELIKRVDKLSSPEARELLKKMNPDLLLVNGTRIISKKTLECVSAPFMNIHVGITPLFRGVHGGYWAMATGRKELFGITLHYVDPGVDTGGIIEQVFTQPGKRDNFYTYPYLEYAVCLPILKKVIEAFVSGQKPAIHQPVTNESALWFHPTIFQWLRNMNKTLIIVFLFAFAGLFSELFCGTLCPGF